jgi:hypothetical protein
VRRQVSCCIQPPEHSHVSEQKTEFSEYRPGRLALASLVLVIFTTHTAVPEQSGRPPFFRRCISLFIPLF